MGVHLRFFCDQKCARRLRRESLISVRCAFVDEPLDGNWRKEPLDSLLCHLQGDSATGCDGLEDPRCTRTIGNASHLALGPHGKACDKLPDKVSSGTAWHGSRSKRHLHFFKELLLLWLWKTNDQPGETRQQSISVARLQARSRQKIRADHSASASGRNLSAGTIAKRREHRDVGGRSRCLKIETRVRWHLLIN